MKRHEYEQRKRILDEQLRLALDLVHAGHRAQVQVLEMLWKTSGGEVLDTPEASAVPSPPEPPPPSPTPLPKPRRPAGELYDEVEEALAQLPEEFTKNDVHRCLGYAPDRASLFRILDMLQREGRLDVKLRGTGNVPSVYRKKQEGAL